MLVSNSYDIGTQILAGPQGVRSASEDMSFFIVIMWSVYASKSSIASVDLSIVQKNTPGAWKLWKFEVGRINPAP